MLQGSVAGIAVGSVADMAVLCCAVLCSDLLCGAVPSFVLLFHVSLLCELPSCSALRHVMLVIRRLPALLVTPDDVKSLAYLCCSDTKALCHADCTVQPGYQLCTLPHCLVLFCLCHFLLCLAVLFFQ